MKKQELIQIHGLLDELSGHFSDELELSLENESFEEYQNIETKPIHIHKSKSDHKDAILALVNAIETATETETTPKTVL
jgi:hypothetical protein